ncbi:MAG: serine protease [Chloroflexota bacterium]|nr:serine protease [Chloroflexota bacterium]
MVRLFLTLLLFFALFAFGCGPSQDEIEDTIDSKFQNLMAAVPTATPITMPTPVPTATPITIIELEEDLRNLLDEPYATPQPNLLNINTFYDKYRKSVVLIEHGGTSGTGWAIDKDYIVTNEHVITDANSVDIFVPSSDGQTVKKIGWVRSWNENSDLAFIKSENHGAVPLTRRQLTSQDAGISVVQIGYSTGVANYPAVREGIVVSAFNQMGTAAQYSSAPKYQILNDKNYSNDLFPVVVVDTGADPGDSGGPIIDYEGNVVGVIYAQVQTIGGKRVIGQQLAVGMKEVNDYWKICNGPGGSCN